MGTIDDAIQRVGVEQITEWYGIELIPLHKVAERLGVSPGAFSVALHSRYPEILASLRTVRSQRLHDLQAEQVTAQPSTFTDASGATRIDPAHVALMKLRAHEAGRLAGILNRSFRESAELEVKHNTDPLQAYLAQIQAAGSTVPIAGGRVLDGEWDDLEEIAPPGVSSGAGEAG